MREQRKLKTIAFDLDTKALQEHYPKNDWHSAYADIATFLGKQHFMHSQGSVYDSTTPFSDEGLGILIQNNNIRQQTSIKLLVNIALIWA